jgi:transposase
VTGNRRACGDACTARSYNGYRIWGTLIGRGRHSIARVYRLPGGRTYRQGSDQSREVGHEAPHRGGPQRCAAGGDRLGAHAHDSKWLEVTVDAVAPLRLPGKRCGRPRQRPVKLHADKGYDYPRCRRALRARGIISRIARRGIESRERLGRYRWVVERTLSWLNRFRRLKVRYERRADL